MPKNKGRDFSFKSVKFSVFNNSSITLLQEKAVRIEEGARMMPRMKKDPSFLKKIFKVSPFSYKLFLEYTIIIRSDLCHMQSMPR